MELEIGNVAGLIWNYLSQYGKTDVIRLKVELKLTNSTLFLGLGWLLRESKIVLSKEKNLYFVELKK